MDKENYIMLTNEELLGEYAYGVGACHRDIEENAAKEILKRMATYIHEEDVFSITQEGEQALKQTEGNK